MIGIVAAFGDEIRHYLRHGGFSVTNEADSLRFYESQSIPEVVVVKGAIGKEKAQQATTALIDAYKPSRIVSAGFAGGADEEGQPGDIYLCDRLVSVEGPAAFWNMGDSKEQFIGDIADIEVQPPSEEQGYQGAVKYGGCLSTPQIVSSSSMKKWIGTTFSVSVIDLESFWVCETAEKHGVARTVARVVFDPVEQSLPEFIGEAAQDGEGQPIGRALKYILSRPVDTPKMIRLAKQAKIAGRSLGSFLSKMAEHAA